jgi:SP family general alpha glucoside:H+ symporter-like MFS transporter
MRWKAAISSSNLLSVHGSNFCALPVVAEKLATQDHSCWQKKAYKVYDIQEGYDTALLGNFYGIPAFAKKFGHPAAIVDGVQTYQVPASWQSALGNGTAVAQIIGLFFNGIISERIGYRKMMMGSLVLVACCIFITFFAVNVKMLLAGYVLSGLPWLVQVAADDAFGSC